MNMKTIFAVMKIRPKKIQSSTGSGLIFNYAQAKFIPAKIAFMFIQM